MHPAAAAFPTPLGAYPAVSGGLLDVLWARAAADPFAAVATAIFVLAILHTFAAAWFTGLAHRVQHAHDAHAHASGRPTTPSVAAEVLHFLGEVEVVFGLWALPLVALITLHAGWAMPPAP